MDGETRGMVVESFPNWISRWKDGVRHFERPYESLVLLFAERVVWKDPTLQLAKLKSSWGYGFWLERSQTSNAHLIGTRVGIVVARTIRRLLASEREDSNLVVAMRGTPVAGRPADAAAGDAPTVTRHAVEQREVIVVPASSGAPLAAAKASVHLPIQFRTCLSRQLQGHSRSTC